MKKILWNKNFCKDCGTSSAYHVQTWLDEFSEQLSGKFFFSSKLEGLLSLVLEKFFTFTRLVSLHEQFSGSDIPLRSYCFIEEARKRGVKFKALKGPFGFTNNFIAEMDGKTVRFESLPVAEFASKFDVGLVDNKERTKNKLKKAGLPVAEGKAFWFWQKNRAVDFGTKKLGFPLVVKPRSGSVSRHVTTNIEGVGQLKEAVSKVIAYSPAFIVEKFVSKTFVHRATVVDFRLAGCAKQVPANVEGNGVSTIKELIDDKNKKQNRDDLVQKNSLLHKIAEDKTTEKLLAEKGYGYYSVPENNEIVWLQKDPFLKLGGDLVELTPQVHPDNIKLFEDTAKLFDIRVVGIDFLCRDISIPWHDQPCAILELNSLPCIEMHHFPSSGAPQNVAKAMTDLFFKYYP